MEVDGARTVKNNPTGLVGKKHRSPEVVKGGTVGHIGQPIGLEKTPVLRSRKTRGRTVGSSTDHLYCVCVCEKPPPEGSIPSGLSARFSGGGCLEFASCIASHANLVPYSSGTDHPIKWCI